MGQFYRGAPLVCGCGEPLGAGEGELRGELEAVGPGSGAVRRQIGRLRLGVGLAVGGGAALVLGVPGCAFTGGPGVGDGGTVGKGTGGTRGSGKPGSDAAAKTCERFHAGPYGAVV